MEPKGSILLVYFVADESGSMGRNIGELNEGLASLHDALQRESFAAAKVRLSVIGFSDTAFTYLEPADLRLLEGMPSLTAQSLTSYASAFDQLAYRISVDIPGLKAQGYTVHRPAVFFLTDGLPNGNEDWRTVRSNLLAQPAAPNILAFGIGDADAAIGVRAGDQAQLRVRRRQRGGHWCRDLGVHHLADAVGDQFRAGVGGRVG